MKKIILICLSALITSLAIGQTSYVRVKDTNLFEKPDINSDIQIVLHAGCEVKRVDLVSLQKKSKHQWTYVNVKLKGQGEYEGYVLKKHLIRSKAAVNTRNFVYEPTKKKTKNKQIFWSNPEKIVKHLQPGSKDNKPFVQRKFQRDKRGIYYKNDRGKKVYIKRNK